MARNLQKANPQKRAKAKEKAKDTREQKKRVVESVEEAKGEQNEDEANPVPGIISISIGRVQTKMSFLMCASCLSCLPTAASNFVISNNLAGDLGNLGYVGVGGLGILGFVGLGGLGFVGFVGGVEQWLHYLTDLEHLPFHVLTSLDLLNLLRRGVKYKKEKCDPRFQVRSRFSCSAPF